MNKSQNQYNDTRYKNYYRWTIEIPIKLWEKFTTEQQHEIKQKVRADLMEYVGGWE